MRAIVFHGASQYNVLSYFTRDVARAMRRRGLAVTEIDMAEKQSTRWVSDRLKEAGPVDFTFTFQILTAFRDPDGRTIADITGAPHLCHYVDHPLTALNNLREADRRCAILTVDPSHAETLHAIFGDGHFAYVGFCPHGAIGAVQPLPDDADRFIAERPIALLFTGSYYRPQPPYHESFPAQIQKLFGEAAEIALAEEWIAPLDALDRVLQARGLDIRDPAILHDLNTTRSLCAFIGEHVRKTRRNRFIDAAQRAGLKLTVYGSGFDAVLGRYHHIDYRGLAAFEEILAAMRQARMLVNTNANFGKGAHERALSAMLAGAAVASDSSAYYRDRFVPGREIALFRWRHLDEDLAALRDLGKDPRALLAMARAGQAKAAANERWDNRIDTILHAAAIARAEMRDKRSEVA